VVVAILTSGAGTELVGTATTTAAGGTTISLGSTALLTTSGYTATGALINAGFTSLATSAALSLANNNFNLGDTLKDLGSSATIRGMVSAMLSAGVGGYFKNTYNLESLIGKTIAGCAASEISGGDCKSAAVETLALQGLAWGANEMRQNQINNSSQFKGICVGNSNNCENNLTKPSVGVGGDNLGLGGGRWDVVRICGTQGFECKLENGFVKISGNGVETLVGTPSERLQEIFRANGADLLSPMGGIQGSTGYLKLFGIGPEFYEKGSFWDKWVVEPFSGTHDQFNSFSTYDTLNDPGYLTFQTDFQGNLILQNGNFVTALAPRFVGNIQPMTNAEKWISATMNVIDIPLASPFALATIADQLPPGALQILTNSLKTNNDIASERGNE